MSVSTALSSSPKTCSSCTMWTQCTRTCTVSQQAMLPFYSTAFFFFCLIERLICFCSSTDDNVVDQQAIDQVYKQIHQTCKDIGFFYITGHGVKQSTMDLLLRYTQKFFALPMEKKTALSIHKSPSYNGYIEPGTKYSLESCTLT